MTKRAIGIVRVSQTRGREGDSFHSPATQLARIEAKCKAEGLRLIEHHEELDVSGGRPLNKRPGLKLAVEAIEAGRADVIVVAYLDRLVRSVAVQAEVVQRVEAAGGRVLAVDSGYITDDDEGWLSGAFLGLIAEHQRRTTRVKVREAQERAIARGVAPWKSVPAGYLKGPDKRYVPDPKLRPVIREAFERRARKESVNSIRAFLAQHGIHRTYAGVVELFTLTAYVGEVRFGKLVNPTAHEPIVSRELFDRVQRVRVPRDHPKPPSDRLLARLDVLRCAHCGARMVVARGGNGNPLYRCPPNGDCTHHPSITATTVEDYVADHVRELLADLTGTASSDNVVARAKAEFDRAQDAFDNAVHALADFAGEASVVAKLRTLRDARDAARTAYEDAADADQATRVAITAGNWDDLTGQERRDLIQAVIDRVDVRRGGRGIDRLTLAVK